MRVYVFVCVCLCSGDILVTESVKTSLMNNDSRFNLSSQIQNFNDILLLKSPGFRWSDFAGCFLKISGRPYK